MKILFLLFAVVFLVFQTQSEAVAETKNEAEAQAPDAVEAEAQDEAAEISSPDLMPQEAPIHCARQLGVCRIRCSQRERRIGWCSRGMACCRKRF
ncbi:alpha-defensin 26-like [Chelonia mydas]|uniref:alpha-defensin 26-like n=1 Tax=Chelonia mydas TaxID=8469 RepID=UPI0018A1C1B3|nr:alpha-defensin 26-like [Chelonia mydas]